MPQQLIAAAHGDDRAAVLHIGFEILLDALQFLTDDPLLPIGAAAQQYDVQLLEGDGILQQEFPHFRLHAAPFQPLAHTLDIPPIAIQVQQVGVQMSDGQFHASPSFCSAICISARRVGSSAV